MIVEGDTQLKAAYREAGPVPISSVYEFHWMLGPDGKQVAATRMLDAFTFERATLQHQLDARDSDESIKILRTCSTQFILVGRESAYTFSDAIRQDMNIYAVAVGLLGLIWFLLIFQFSFTDCLSIDEDRKFVEYYGNHPRIDGTWEVARDMRVDVPRMKNVSGQVHYRVFLRTPLIKNVSFAEKELHFDPSLDYKPMKIEAITYTTDEEEAVEGAGGPRPHHFTKALWPDCVFYLVSRDAEAKTVSIDKQVCGIEVKSFYGFD